MKRSVKVNYIYNLIYKLLMIILPFVTIPYVSRVLNPDGVGAFNYTNSVALIFTMVASLGTTLYAQKEIAFAKDDVESRTKVFKSILAIRVISTLIVTIPYVILAILSKQYRWLYAVQYIFVLANMLDISWLLQGIEDFKNIALRGIVVKILTVLSIFIFVKEKDDLIIYALISGLASLFNSAILWMFIKDILTKVKITKKDVVKHIKPVLLLALPVMAIYVYTYVDKVFLRILSTEEEVGFYSQAENIVKTAMTIVTSLGVVLLPRISSLISSKKWNEVKVYVLKAIKFVMVVGLPMVMGMALVSPLFVPWFLGEDFEPCIFLLSLLSPLTVIIGLAAVTGQAVLIPLEKQKIYTASIFIGAFLNIIINSLLIPRYGAIGASIGTLAAELTVTTIQEYVVFKEIKITIWEVICDNVKAIIATIIMGVILYFVRRYFEVSILSTVIYALVGTLIYGLSLLIMKEKTLYDIVGMLKLKK